MIMTSEQLEQIASAGGGLILDGSMFTFNQLKGIVEAAGGAGSTITIHKVAGLTSQQLLALSMAAPTVVVFDLVR